MNMYYYVWIVPFCSFIAGYMVTQWIFTVKVVPAPHLIGKKVHEILPVITPHQLYLQLIQEKEEPNITAGVILSQSPAPGTLIKPRQTIFLVTTKKPVTASADNYVGTHMEKIMPSLSEKNSNPRIYALNHPYPEQVCLAQSPRAGDALINNQLVLYISAGNNKPIIWPNFIGLSYAETKEFLLMYDIIPYTIGESSNENTAIIIDQRPLAGTLLTINTKQPLSVQLKIH